MKSKTNKAEQMYDRLYKISLAIIVLGLIAILMIRVARHGEVYGSETDWINQHVQFADYLRNSFYSTGNIYPDFMEQLGGGQNAIQLTYYGLFRPEILVSYLFPFIEMKTYFILSSIVITMFSVEIFYYWLRKENISSHISFFTSILFICAGPILFHTHRHLLFINYIPWLILSFIGIKRYLTKRKSDLMVISIAMIFLSSFFFGVSSLFMCGIYAIYCVLELNETITIKKFILELLRLLFHVVIALMIVCFMLVPTAYMMLGDHREALETPTIKDLLLPNLSYSTILYEGGEKAYSAGMTAISFISVFYFIWKNKRANRVLGWLILIVISIPLFSYILNGMQYVREKPFITMIPLLGYMIAKMLTDLQVTRKTKFLYMLPVFFIPAFYFNGDLQKMYLIDVISISLLLLLFMKSKYKIALLAYLIIPIMTILPNNKSELYLTESKLSRIENEEKIKLISDVLDKDQTYYRFDDHDYALRTSNQVPDLRMNKTSIYSSSENYEYNHFFYDVFKMAGVSTNNVNQLVTMNPYFQSFMSVKYLYTKSRIPLGYEKVSTDGSGYVIENNEVLPMAYISYNLMSNSDFSTLNYPYSMETLFQNTVIDGDSSNVNTSNLQEVNLAYSILDKDDGIEVKKEGSDYRFKVKKNKQKIRIKLDKPISNQIMILSMKVGDVKNGISRSTRITINGIVNKLSATNDIYANNRYDFSYVLSENKSWDVIDIELSKGEYTIKDPKAYLVEGSTLSKRFDEVDKVEFIDNSNAIIDGKVNIDKDGYFVTSLPFDKGFNVSVDGEKITGEKVNTAFLGFPISKGTHHVVISYVIPGKKIGILVSFIAILCCFVLKFKKKLKINKLSLD